MRFDLKKPCKDCPFLKGSSTNKSLAEGRIAGIIEYITVGDKTFACHKTVNYGDDTHKVEQHCAGALIYAKREEARNSMLQIAERLGIYDPDKINENYPNIITKEDL